jgi:WD40 repeat protein
MLNEADQTLISGSSDQTIKTWNANTGLCLKTIDTGLDIVALAVLSSTKLEGKTLFFFFFFFYLWEERHDPRKNKRLF